MNFLRDKKAFSLIEMTIMIAVGAVMMIGLTRATQTQAEQVVEMRNYLIAMNLAKRQMAIMHNAAYPNAGTTNPTADSDFPDFSFTQVVTETSTNASGTVREIRMDVSRNGVVMARLYTCRTSTAAYGDGT